jgi:hypothetical protein
VRAAPAGAFAFVFYLARVWFLGVSLKPYARPQKPITLNPTQKGARAQKLQTT